MVMVDKANETKEKDKLRRDKLSGLAFDMAKLTFAGMVLAGFTPLVNNHTVWDWLNVAIGLLLTAILILIGKNILK